MDTNTDRPQTTEVELAWDHDGRPTVTAGVSFTLPPGTAEPGPGAVQRALRAALDLSAGAPVAAGVLLDALLAATGADDAAVTLDLAAERRVVRVSHRGRT